MKLSVTITGPDDLRRLGSSLAERVRQAIERDPQAGMTTGLDGTPHREILAQAIRRLARS